MLIRKKKKLCHAVQRNFFTRRFLPSGSSKNLRGDLREASVVEREADELIDFEKAKSSKSLLNPRRDRFDPCFARRTLKLFTLTIFKFRNATAEFPLRVSPRMYVPVRAAFLNCTVTILRNVDQGRVPNLFVFRFRFPARRADFAMYSAVANFLSTKIRRA